MAKKYHQTIYDRALEQISSPANWGGGVLTLAVVIGNPATAAAAATLYPAGNRISAPVALVGGDLVLAVRPGGGGMITVAAKSPVADVTVTKRPGGTATAGGASTLTDTGKAWSVDEHIGWVAAITGGTGVGQSLIIASNTATQLTTEKPWTTPPDATSVYQIRPDINIALYDGGGSPRLLALSNEVQDNDVAQNSTLTVPAFVLEIVAP